MSKLPIARVVLYKHGVGYFERRGSVDGDTALSLTFKQSEVSDVLKSLVVLDRGGGHIASVSYDSTKPLNQLLSEVAISIPDEESLLGLLPQLKGGAVEVKPPGGASVVGMLLGVDRVRRLVSETVVNEPILSILTDDGHIQSFHLNELNSLRILDEAVRRDLDYVLRSQLSAMKQDARGFTMFAKGEGNRELLVGYNIAAPVWKATYRMLIHPENEPPPSIQGWAVVDNTQDEDWNEVELTLIAGLPVSFTHDLYTPRAIYRPEVTVNETTGVVPPQVEEGMTLDMAPPPSTYGDSDFVAEPVGLAFGESSGSYGDDDACSSAFTKSYANMEKGGIVSRRESRRYRAASPETAASAPAKVLDRKLGDFFAYEIEHPVTIQRNQSALVPILFREFKGGTALLYNPDTRKSNPMRCVEFENTTGLTLEGGPVTVFESGDYVGEAMLETLKPDEHRLVPFAVELGVSVLDKLNNKQEPVSQVIVRDGVMTLISARHVDESYVFKNKGATTYKVYFDHPRSSDDGKLIETQEPVEITPNYRRFRFNLGPNETQVFSIRLRKELKREVQLKTVGSEEIFGYIEKGYFSEIAVQSLRQLIKVNDEVEETLRSIDRIQVQLKQIKTNQERIRENLQALTDRASEKNLRERYVKSLVVQEDEFEKLTEEHEIQTTVLDRTRSQLSALLSKFQYDAAVKSL